MPSFLSHLRRLPQSHARASHNDTLKTKASRAGKLTAMGDLSQAVWSPRDYASLAREGYQKNPVVYRCVRLLAESIASVPLLAQHQGRELDQHPILKLLDKPNSHQSGPAFMEAVVGHLMIAGNAYIEAVSLDNEIQELHALRPDRMKVVPGRQGWPAAYDYTAAGEVVRFSQEGEGVRPILHLTQFHPTNDYYGLAPLEAAASSLDLLNAAASWNKALLDNSARPSGALVYAPSSGANLTQDQFERLKQELEESFSGANNAGRPMVLEGGLDWKALSLTPQEMDFVAARAAAAREVALAFGVPPMLLGLPGDNTYSNYQEANRAFWRQAVLPLLGRLCRSLSQWLEPSLGEVTLWYDSDAIEALSVEREALWSRVSAANFLTDDEKRTALGYGVAP